MPDLSNMNKDDLYAYIKEADPKGLGKTVRKSMRKVELLEMAEQARRNHLAAKKASQRRRVQEEREALLAERFGDPLPNPVSGYYFEGYRHMNLASTMIRELTHRYNELAKSSQIVHHMLMRLDKMREAHNKDPEDVTWEDLNRQIEHMMFVAGGLKSNVLPRGEDEP